MGNLPVFISYLSEWVFGAGRPELESADVWERCVAHGVKSGAWASPSEGSVAGRNTPICPGRTAESVGERGRVDGLQPRGFSRLIRRSYATIRSDGDSPQQARLKAKPRPAQPSVRRKIHRMTECCGRLMFGPTGGGPGPWSASPGSPSSIHAPAIGQACVHLSIRCSRNAMPQCIGGESCGTHLHTTDTGITRV